MERPQSESATGEGDAVGGGGGAACVAGGQASVFSVANRCDCDAVFQPALSGLKRFETLRFENPRARGLEVIALSLITNTNKFRG